MVATPRRRRLQPITVESVGRPVVVSGIARLLLAMWREEQARPKPVLVVDNDESSSDLREVIEGHQRRID